MIPKSDKQVRMSIQSAKFESGQVLLPEAASSLDALETELLASGRSLRRPDRSISQALSYEISRGELMTDAALKGYGNLIDGLCFERAFYGR